MKSCAPVKYLSLVGSGVLGAKLQFMEHWVHMQRNSKCKIMIKHTTHISFFWCDIL